jgi:hypothetical protein
MLEYDVICRSYREAVGAVLYHGAPMLVSFDHDLGEDTETGYDFAKWLVEADLDGRIILLDNFTFTVHSANPVGAENIQKLLDAYLKFKKDPLTRFRH